jgi:hypothetical protein
MKIFVTVDAGGRVIEPYGEGVSPSIPADAVLLSDVDGALITQAEYLGDYLLVNGALQVDAAFVATRQAQLQKAAIQSQIDALERTQLLPRVTREGLMAAAVALAATQSIDEPTLYAQNIAYHKLKDFDAQIAGLRAQMAAIT